MGIFLGTHRWMVFLIAASVTGAWCGSSGNEIDRHLNPYHEQQLQSQITKCAGGVLACSDAEKRCLKQQELCQLLMRAERYDEALQVANNIYKTDSAGPERSAAHHYLMAEIYNRKMKASRTKSAMEMNRDYALSVAQDVVKKKYPSSWGVSEHARALIRDLNDSTYMGQVRHRVAIRQGSGDPAKEAIAEAQRKYLDATQGGGTHHRPQPSAKFARVAQDHSQEEELAISSAADQVKDYSNNSARTSPEVTRTVSPVRYQTGEVFNAGDKLSKSGLLTSQPGAPAESASQRRQPILINGNAVTQNRPSVDEVVQNNLAELLKSAHDRRQKETNSPYATGQLPTSVR